MFVQCLKLLLSSGPSHYGNNENNNSSSHAVYANDHVLKREHIAGKDKEKKLARLRYDRNSNNYINSRELTGSNFGEEA